MNHLSERLVRIAAQVQPGHTLADVGCDHAYLPILLVKDARMKHAIAMDINEGPLLRAKEHIAGEALGDYIETRLSDGLEKLKPHEADAVIIAGMGGNLMIDILIRGMDVVRTLDQLILEPQSELAAVRRFLREQNFCVEQEDLVLEDGKYYPILRVLPKQPSDVSDFGRRNGLDVAVLDAYGHQLLASHHQVLRMFLNKERQQCERILDGLPEKGSSADRIEVRRTQLKRQLERNRAAEAYMKESE